MKRSSLISVFAAVALVGCAPEFSTDGLTFVGEGGKDVVTPDPDVPQGPKSCEELWNCVLENNCPLAPTIDDDVCLKKCAGEQDDEHVMKFLELKECASASCSTMPSGDGLITCSYEFCTDKWLTCVAAGDGDRTCGDMHRCLWQECGPDYSSPECVSNCLRDGSVIADSLLVQAARCNNPVFYAAAPLECTGGMAACYAGSHGGGKSCGKALTCEIGCYESICPDPDLCTSFNDLVGCFYDCLWGLSDDEAERMYALQQCMVNYAHDKLLDEKYNVYSYCAAQASECLGFQDEFATCQDSVQCLKEHYNFFPAVFSGAPLHFWMVVRDCLVDVIHPHKVPLGEAIKCLADNYEGGAIGLIAPWADCKTLCPVP